MTVGSRVRFPGGVSRRPASAESPETSKGTLRERDCESRSASGYFPLSERLSRGGRYWVRTIIAQGPAVTGKALWKSL